MIGNDRYRKRKGDEWRLVDVALLPPLENVDPDRLKLFSKDEIRSYLRHYDIPPAETKPDMKRQLRTLIMGIKAGTIRKLEGIGSKINPISIHNASFSGAIQSPVITPSTPTMPIVDYKSYFSPKQPSLLTNTVARNRQIDLHLNEIKDNVFPDSNSNMLNKANGLIGPDGFQLTVPQTDDLTCVGCGKRSNKECKFKRCKNCCNAALLKCGVHARHISLLPGQVLSNAPDDNDRLTIISGTSSTGNLSAPFEAGTNAPNPNKPTYEEPSEPVLSKDPYTGLTEYPLLEQGEEDPTDIALRIGLERLNQNYKVVQDIFNKDNIQDMFKSLQGSSIYSESEEENLKNVKASLVNEEKIADEIFKHFRQSINKQSEEFLESYRKISDMKTEEDINEIKKKFSIKERKENEQPTLNKSTKSEMDSHFDVQLLTSL